MRSKNTRATRSRRKKDINTTHNIQSGGANSSNSQCQPATENSDNSASSSSFEFPDVCYCSHKDKCHVWKKVSNPRNRQIDDVHTLPHKLFTHVTKRKWDKLQPFGSPAVQYDEDTSITDIAESIFQEPRALEMIQATNKHGENDNNYDDIPADKDGIKLIKGYLSILEGSAIKGGIPFDDIWCEIPGVGDPFLASFMTKKRFKMIHRHIQWVDPTTVPDRRSRQYHPYRTVKKSLDLTRARSRELWNASRLLTVDESRLRSTARGDKYRSRNPDKPIKNGKDIHTLGDAGQHADGYVLNELVYAGRYTYTNEEDPRMYNIVKQLLEPYYNTGRIIEADNKYCSMHALEHGRDDTGC